MTLTGDERSAVLKEHDQWLADMEERKKKEGIRPHRCNGHVEDFVHGFFSTPREIVGPFKTLFNCFTSSADTEIPRYQFKDGSHADDRSTGLESYMNLQSHALLRRTPEPEGKDDAKPTPSGTSSS